MLSPESQNNTQENRQHYDKIYSNNRIERILRITKDVDAYLDRVTVSDTSWVCMYYGNFREQIKGKKILELGCGNCFNAAIMASLGAEVYANDISDRSGDIIEIINKEADFEYPIQYYKGDFLKNTNVLQDFDFVIGKAFLHHLTHEQEIEFLKKIVSSLKKDGQARFVEPAVNNLFVDKLRWMVPVPRRPSSLQPKKFKAWLDKDPHPVRDNSGKHYRQLGLQFFANAKIHSVGTIARLHRLIPDNKWNRKFRIFAFKLEQVLPMFIQDELARTQTVIYDNPLQQNSK